MIDDLVRFYEKKVQEHDPKMASDSRSCVDAKYGLNLDAEGNLIEITSLKHERALSAKGKAKPKTIVEGKSVTVPLQTQRTSGIAARYLCDTATYLLGLRKDYQPDDVPDDQLDERDAKKRMQLREDARKRFEADKAYHLALLPKDNPATKAITAFFAKWNPNEAEENPLVKQQDKDFMTANLVFALNGELVVEDASLMDAWDSSFFSSKSDSSAPIGICGITGKRDRIARIHGKIQGVFGAQSAGAALSSFNCDSLNSFDKEQNFNGPVSESAASAYTKALNYLLSDSKRTMRAGNTTVVFWAENANAKYQDFLASLLNGPEAGTYTSEDLLGFAQNLCDGKPVEFEKTKLDPEVPFYLLGLSPNAARLSVRFYYRSTFGKLLLNVTDHYRRLELVHASFLPKYLSIPTLVLETVRKKDGLTVKLDDASPLLFGALFDSIISGSRYPDGLLSNIITRIQTDGELGTTRSSASGKGKSTFPEAYGRVAIIKAIFLQNYRDYKELQEVSTVALNRETTYQPYVLGRIFAVLEEIQVQATGKTTIKDRFLNSASSTPRTIFPLLFRLENAHMKVLKRNNEGLGVYWEKILSELVNKLPSTLPARLTLQEQGSFMLGYYHQYQDKFTGKKEKEENV